MNHDITHCQGKECHKKEECYRFKALQDVSKPMYISIFMDENKCCIEDNYKYFMEL